MQLSGDKALAGAEADRLGFAATADAIADALLRQPKVDGLVVGIEGRWGSGKSSLVNMTVAALRRAETSRVPEIVEFKPWLIGDRNSLLLALFNELAVAVDAIEEGAGDASARRRRDLGSAGEKIRKFAAQLGGLGAMAKAAGAVVPALAILGEVAEATADAAKNLDKQPSITEEKGALRDRLALLPRRIVVTIDDVDRLEPSEAIEILRLVRSVADFPNVIYLLCYDPEIVAHSIEVAAQVDNGRTYIEKIVQIEISVPLPEAFDLRLWFRQEINALPHTSDEASTWRSRLESTINIEGGRYLSTPRHVARCLDGIRFFWSALHDQVDLSDLVWLHLIKVGNSKLYHWIESYLPETAAQASGVAIVSEEERRYSLEALEGALLAEGTKVEQVRHRLTEILPGFDWGFGFGEDRSSVHAHVPKEEIASAARSRRLASPDHYRLYFAIQQPRNSPSQADFEALFAAMDASVDDMSDLLGRWSKQRLTSGASKAEAVLSRIVDADGEAFGPGRSQVLLCALAQKVDELASEHEGSDNPLAWIEARRVMDWLLPQLGSRRDETLDRMFEGQALDWLTHILRKETIAHGRVGERPSSDRLLETGELDRISAIMADRYRKLCLEDWTKFRRPFSALFAWLKIANGNGPKEKFESIIVTDEGLLSVLEILGGRVTSTSRGEYMALMKSNLTHFIDYASARARTEKLAREATDPGLRQRAEKLAIQFANDDH